jgi:hypothetical protein
MKKLSLIFLAIVITIGTSYSQCNSYYDFKEGTLFEVKSFNAKNKEEGRSISKVTSYSQSGDGFEAIINSTVYDRKDKEVHQGDFQMSCSNGMMLIDMRKFIPEESLKAMQGAEIEITGDFLEIPSRLSVGQTLKDGFIEMKVSTQPGFGMNTTITINNRKVESKETVTTPAGTFDCFKISYNINAQTKMMGMNMNNLMKAEEWVSEGVGVVKTSSYNSKGSLMGYTLLSRYEK